MHRASFWQFVAIGNNWEHNWVNKGSGGDFPPVPSPFVYDMGWHEMNGVVNDSKRGCSDSCCQLVSVLPVSGESSGF